jgi:hypothetical protein
MHSRSKHLHGLGQIGRMRDGNQRLFLPQLLHIFERDGFPLSSLLGELVEGGDFALVRVGEADYEEEVCVQIAVVKGPRCGAGVGAVAEEEDVGSARFDEEL